MKRFAKKFSAVVSVVAVLLCVLLCGTGCAKVKVNKVESDPTQQVVSSLLTTVQHIEDKETPFGPLLEAAKQGAISLSVSGDELGSIENKYYADAEAGAYADELLVDIGGTELMLALYSDGEDLAVSSRQLFGDKIYGLRLNHLKDDLLSSGIWDLAGVSYNEFFEMYGDTVDELVDALTGNGAKLDAKAIEELTAAVKTGLKDADVTVKKEKVSVVGKDVDAVNVVYDLTAEDLRKTLKAVFEWGTEYFGSSLLAVLEEDGVSMEEQLHDALEDVTVSGKLAFAINPKTEDVMKIEMDFSTDDESDESAVVSLELGEKPAESEKFIVKCNATGENASSVEIVVKRTNSKTSFVRELLITAKEDGEETTASVSFAVDKKAETFTLAVKSDDANAEMSGDLSYDKKKFEMSVDEIKADGEKVDVSFEMSAAVGGNVPAVPAFTNMATLSAAELTALVQGLASQLMGLMGSAGVAG